MNDKKIIMIDCNSITSYGELPLMYYDVEYFGLNDGMEIIAYEGDDVWNATVHYNPEAEFPEQWWVELGDYIETLTEKEVKWSGIGFFSGMCSGAFRKEIDIAKELIDFGMEINDIQKILKLSENRLYHIKFSNLYTKFEEKVISDGWTFEPQYRNVDLSEYPILSKCSDNAFCMFLNYVKKAETADSSAWFLCASDYENINDTDGFSWNEFEKISLASAESDDEKENIKKWWEHHLPVAMSVKGEYTFLAIDIDTGNIVQGYEPDFEDTETVAGNFEELIKMIISGKFTWI
ncbi:MAG: hypothetical protein K2J32_03175 [Ruminococcus sp.]|nr:hypothetical protein [Ruminococcus sp.]